MNAFAKSATLALLTSVLATPALAADYYTTGFNSMPGAFTVAFGSDVRPGEPYYSQLDVTKAWSVGQIGKHGYAAICPSRSIDLEKYLPTGLAQDSRLTSPAIAVTSPDARVTWEARSLHPDFLESYKVLVSVDGSDTFVELLSVEAEASVWTYRSLSLAEYVGHDVKVMFVCNSIDKFMLCIDNLEIGVPKDYRFNVVNRTPHFVAQAPTRTVDMSLTIVGKTINSATAYIIANGETVGEHKLNNSLVSGDEVTLTFDIPLTLNAVTQYEVHIKDASGSDISVLEDKVMCSHFTRRMIIDKATGTWCTNCPEGDIILQHLEETYGDEIITLTTHTGDVMALGSYFANLGFSSVPSFMLNRNRETKSSSNAYFDKEFSAPTLVGLSAAASISSANRLSVNADVQFAESWDNSSDRYRLAYTMTREYHEPENGLYVQANSAIANPEQFAFMPGYILPDIMIYRNVTVDNTTAFTGVAGSLPSSISAGTVHTATLDIAIPSAITDLETARLILYVIDTQTGYAHNATSINLAETAKADDILTDSHNNLNISLSGSLCRVFGTADGADVTLEAYAPDGRIKAYQTKKSSEDLTFDLSALNGLHIVHISDGKNTVTHKVIIK
jgi:thiol-disulfide isomerase/thioredoxin